MELERKLAAAELDVKLLRESLKETVQKHAEELKKQEERVWSCCSGDGKVFSCVVLR